MGSATVGRSEMFRNWRTCKHRARDFYLEEGLSVVGALLQLEGLKCLGTGEPVNTEPGALHHYLQERDTKKVAVSGLPRKDKKGPLLVIRPTARIVFW